MSLQHEITSTTHTQKEHNKDIIFALQFTM